LPPSLALRFKTAWAVVPLPIKLSKIIEFLFVANCKARSIVPIGLGLGKSFLSNLSSLTKISVPRSLFTSLKSQIDVDFIFSLTSK